MRIGRSSNPALSGNRFLNSEYVGSSDEVMTINGAINKTLILFGILSVSAYYTWTHFLASMPAGTLIAIGAIGGLILAFATVFKPQWSPVTAPLYAAFEGVAVGAISAMYAGFLDGIVLQAVGLTFSILFIMLALYRTGVLRATPKFKRGIIIATAGIFFFYILNWIFGMFGGGVNIANFGLLGIGIQLFIVGVASLNLILDFDNIEKGAERGLPDFFEWYSAFGIMVTLIWLYIEMLRLLSMLSRN